MSEDQANQASITVEVQTLLNRLSNMQDQRQVITMAFEDLRKSVIPDEVQKELDDISLEETMSLEAVDKGIKELDSEIRDYTSLLKTGVKGDYLYTTHSKPRITWDSPGLEGYAVAHPEILTFRKVGKPVIQIRIRK